MAQPGIICFEGDWNPDLRDRLSIRPLVDMLAQEPKARTIYRRIGALDALEKDIASWSAQRYRDYRLGCFAFHGSEGAIHLGRRKLSFEQMPIRFGRHCAGKVIFFASCSVMRAPRASIKRLRRDLGAHTICGYTEDVDWYEAAAFELLLFDAFTRYSRPSRAIEWLREEHGGFARKLGFKSDPGWLPRPSKPAVRV